MKRFFSVFCISILALFNLQAQREEIRFPENAKLPKSFRQAILTQTNEYNRLFYRDSTRTKYYPESFILDKIDNDSNYQFIFLAEYWIAFHYDKIIPDLIKRITNKKEIGLVNSADLIIWERVNAKQMNFYGHGGICKDDLFTIAGRANRLLTVITGEDFGHVSMYSTQTDLELLQKKWMKWLKRL